MTYFDCKRIKRMIDRQRLRVAELREKTTSFSVNLDGMPKCSSSNSRTEQAVEDIQAEEIKLKHLEDLLSNALKAIPDKYMQELINLKVNKNRSWTWIAVNKGNGSSGNSIRMMCHRYRWEFST